jgi:hypothetical protein
MEGKVFPSTSVAVVLTSGFIEARLHTDGLGQPYTDEAELQKRMTKTVALPTYAIVDPASPEVALRVRSGMTPATAFVDFLRGQ